MNLGVFMLFHGLLDAIALVVLVYWAIVLWHVIRTWRNVPGGIAGIELARTTPSARSVTVIVPAHNEEAAIARLIPTLLAQDFPRFRVLLCLDRCTDATERVARELIGCDPRFEILRIDSCAENWAGKTNAVWTGVRHAEQGFPASDSDLLLFIDADTMLHPSCISAAAALLEHRNLDLLSFLSTMTYERWFEWVAQPAAGMELMRQYPLIKSNRTSGRRRPFANGQFMLFRRDVYDAIGGHEGVRDELLEDMALARAVAEGRGTLGRAGRTGVFLAQETLTCRMYDSWAQFQQGWKRIYIETAKRRVRRLRDGMHCALWLGAVGPWSMVVYAIVCAWRLAETHAPKEEAWLIAGVVCATSAVVVHALALAASFVIGRTPMRAIGAFGVGSLLTARVLRDAACDLRRGVPTKWGGKEYRREER